MSQERWRVEWQGWDDVRGCRVVLRAGFYTLTEARAIAATYGADVNVQEQRRVRGWNNWQTVGSWPGDDWPPTKPPGRAA